MQKKGYIYVIIAILFTGCADQNTEDPFLNNYNNIQNTYKSSVELNQCMTNSLNKCMTNIVTSKATQAMDESICNDLKNEDLKAECVGSIQLIQAIQETDISKCSSLTGRLLYSCEIDILNIKAQKELDKSICEKIVPDSEVIILDPSVGYLYEGAKNICIDNITAKVAINDLDDDICENIEDQDIKNYCEEEIIYQKELKDSESKVNEMVPAGYKEGENALSQ